MYISKLTIQNFRNIGVETTYNLNQKFTVFIGINGKGKSTILHALRIACGTFFLGIPGIGRRHIQNHEIRLIESGKQLLPQFPVKVEATGYFPESKLPVVWRRQRLLGSSSTTSNNADVGTVKKIAAEHYRKVMQEGNDTVGLPVIAYLGTSRVFASGRNTINSRVRLQRIGRKIFSEGYQDWDEMKASKFHFNDWLNTYDVLVQIDKEYDRTKEAFLNAIKKANPYISDIIINNGEIWVKVKIDGNESSLLPLGLHSDGVHYFTAMVAELAYRCIVLNGYLNEKAIIESTGIVMIDEIDLHLHPNWQRHVVNDLKEAFPQIQFVVTTHSPFIVQSLESDEIWNLDKEMDVSPKKEKIDTIVTKIMGVSSAYSIENEDEYKKSKKFLSDLEQNKSSKELEEDLEDISDPAIRAFLELSKMTKGK